MSFIPTVIRATYKGGYQIELVFNDGAVGTVDFEQWFELGRQRRSDLGVNFSCPACAALVSPRAPLPAAAGSLVVEADRIHGHVR